ncbi:DUF6502 family protein [Variovorax sp. YR216]|uniref:DUF6502 family protein n=1 Tax=Variovorax sp. YR216 TaxID=1882828 RepID=UPI000899D8C2|nr:DUF6502 family protein [Variovorax sp. YR216]SEB22880.1 hypothetical protein SAMN05444680_1172 [Variovorax sp. YR216]
MTKEAVRAIGASRRGRARALPSAKLAQLAEGQLDWVLAACARVMRPLVRLAVRMGVKHAQLDHLLRSLLVEEAQRTWRDNGNEPNLSQISLTTGLNRKVVTSIVRDTVEHLPYSEMSAPAKTMTLWLRMCTDDPSRRTLPINAVARGPSFEAVAHKATRGNVHHRAVLDELVRLGMVTERSDGFAELDADGFVPARDMRSMLAFLGDNTRDHLLAAVSNTLGGQRAFLERSVFARGIAPQECERIHQIARVRWNALHHELTHELTDAFTAAPKSASARMRIGIYAYYEEGPAPASDAVADASAPPKEGRP